MATDGMEASSETLRRRRAPSPPPARRESIAPALRPFWVDVAILSAWIFLAMAVVVGAGYTLLLHHHDASEPQPQHRSQPEHQPAAAPPGAPEAAPLRVDGRVSLENAYHGRKVVFSLQGVSTLCPVCRGAGSADGLVHECAVCGGSGREERTLRRGNMVQRVLQRCSQCGGAGQVRHGRCASCRGRGLSTRSQAVSVQLEAGQPFGSTVRVPGVGHDRYGHARGAVELRVVRESAGDAYRSLRRSGDDLHTRLRISLAEALLGFRAEVKHPRGSPAVVDRRGAVTGPETVVRLEGLGMPVYRSSPTRYGALVVEFDVDWPASLRGGAAAQRALASAFS